MARSAYTPVHHCPASLNPILDTLGTLSSVEVEDTDVKNTSPKKISKSSNIGGLASLPESQNNTLPVKNRPSSVNNLYLQDFTPLQAILPHSSALEPCLTIPLAPKSIDDLAISQFYEQQPIFHAAKIKDSMNENPNRPKKQRNIIKATEPEAISDFTKFFYLTTEKETAFMVNRTCKASFNSIPSIRYLNYKVHPSPTDDKTELSLTDNTSVLAKSTVYAQTTHQSKNTVQEIKSSSQNQHQPKTKEPTSSRYNKSYNKAYLNLHNKMHYVKKNASQQTNTKIVSQGYAPTVSFPGFWSRFAASVTPDTENACCHVSSLERSQTF